MNAVDSNSIDGMETRQWLASQTAEGNVSADSPHRAARFDSAHDISSRYMLVLKTYVSLRKDPHFVQPAQGPLRQREPATS